MNLPTLATDNITEVLLKIIEFTQTRQIILTQNINGIGAGDFVPKDLPVDEFSKLMHMAIEEHAFSQQLVFQDGKNVKFGSGGNFEATPIIDENAKKLFEKNRDKYLQCQISKMLENSLNQRIALELLKTKRANDSYLGRHLN